MSRTKSAERVVRNIRRKTRRRFSAEEKIRIVLEGLRGEESISHGSRDRRRLRGPRHEDKIVLLPKGHDVDGAQTARPVHWQAIQTGAVLAVQVPQNEGVRGPVEDARVILRHHRRTQL